MEATTTARIIGPSDAQEGFLGSIGVRWMIDGADADRRFSLVEHAMSPRALAAPLHRHTREDEYSIVTEGEIGFRSGDREVVLGPGGYITKPRHELHAMWNAGSVPARMIEIISPAGFEHFFREIVDLSEAEEVTFEGLSAIAERYGLKFGQAEWLPDIIARYNLTPPPAPA